MAKYLVIKTFLTSKAWHDFRAYLIASRGPKCERCGKEISDPLDLIGHHKTEVSPENISDASISLNPDNVMLVCHDCHGEIHQRFGHVNQGRSVYIVWGPPLSGKTSFVRQQAQRGDLVVDIDLLYAAMSLMPEYDKPSCLLSNVMGVRDLLIDNIKTRYGKWTNAWVIGGYPDKYQRDKLADDLGAELIFMDVSKDECMARLNMDEGRRCRRDEWTGFVDKWFERYTT